MINQEITHVGLDKVQRYGWVTAHAQGRFEMINKRLLNVNTEIYQREASKTKVLELASNWSWIACGALIVADRDGVYWVADGQHRKLAADKRSDIKELPCMVFTVASVKDEAKAFLVTNANRKPVTALGKFKAQIAAGDETAQIVNQVLASAGLRLATASYDARDFKAVGLAMELAKKDPDSFSDVMHLAGEMAVADKAPVHKRLLAGLYYLHNRIDGGVNNSRLRSRIKQVGIAGLMEGANKAAAYYGRTDSKTLAEGMLQAVNSRLQKRFEFIGA